MSSGMFPSDSRDPASNGQAQQDASQAQGQQQQPRELKLEDGVSYVYKVKAESQPETYRVFLDILNAYKSQRINLNDVISSVSILFEKHPELIRGFNAFLPPGSEIEVKSQTTTLSGGGNGTSGSGSGCVPLTVNQNLGSTAIMQGKLPEEFFQMENQIQGLSDIRDQLVQILLAYEMGQRTEEEVYEQIIKLFQDEK